MGLATGIYENLIYEALKRKLEALPDEYRINYISIDPAQAPRMLTNYVASLMNRLLSDDRVFEEFEDKIAFVNKVVEFIDTKWDTEPDDDLLINEKKLLGGIINSIGKTEKQLKAMETFRPKSGFTVNTLFTGSNHDLPMKNEINMDILSADEIYWIVAFIRFSGVRIFRTPSSSSCRKMAHVCISSPRPIWARASQRPLIFYTIWIPRRLTSE